MGVPSMLATALLAVVVSVGCARTSDGTPVASAPRAPGPTTTTTTATTTSYPDEPTPGIMPTVKTPVPAGTVACTPEARPSVSVVAATGDPAAPRLTVGVPDGWSSTAGTGDVAVRMQGPDGMAAAVTITPTSLDPEAAFRDYTDGLLAKSAVSSVSILPAQLCQYSGQKLLGAWSDTPDHSIEFRDRVVHVWTNAANYLIVMHVEAPTGTSALVDAAGVITDDVELTIP